MRRCRLGNAVLLDHNGDALTTVGAPTLVIGVDQDAPWRSAHFVSGEYPQTDDESRCLKTRPTKPGSRPATRRNSSLTARHVR